MNHAYVSREKQSQSKPIFGPLFSVLCSRSSVLWSRRLRIDRISSLYPVRKPTLWVETVLFSHLIAEPGFNTPTELSNGVYKPGNDQYYNRHIGRCSSMVEHGFRKAGVEGSNPSIGFIQIRPDFNYHIESFAYNDHKRYTKRDTRNPI